MVGNLEGYGTKGCLILVVPESHILCSDWGGSRTDCGSRDCAVHDPPEVLALQPELHLVDPNIVVGPIEDGDGNFNIVGGSGRHVGCWVSKKKPVSSRSFHEITNSKKISIVENVTNVRQ